MQTDLITVSEARAEAMATAIIHKAGVSAKKRLLEGLQRDLKSATDAYV